MAFTWPVCGIHNQRCSLSSLGVLYTLLENCLHLLLHREVNGEHEILAVLRSRLNIALGGGQRNTIDVSYRLEFAGRAFELSFQPALCRSAAAVIIDEAEQL